MISVIIPTYKEPEYLDLCIYSVLQGQEMKNEIIVVVDGFYDLNKEVLDKYRSSITVLNLQTNQGLSVATNWGVYNATQEFILVVNDDNVFSKGWDTELTNHLQKGRVVSMNQIEPKPSMFKQFIIKNLGTNPKQFNLEAFWDFEAKHNKTPSDNSGSTLPFAMNRLDYLAVGGWDVMYPSPHVVDWDFFAKCEYHGFEMIRIYKSLYHFASVATRSTPKLSKLSSEKEHQAHLFFEAKWGVRAEHNRDTNSKALSIFN